MLWLLYSVCCTTPYDLGFEQLVDHDLMGQVVRLGPIDERMETIAREFAHDIEFLHPLSKLRGINANIWSRSKLPNLKNTTSEFTEDLQYSV